jgi:hypothetical protein
LLPEDCELRTALHATIFLQKATPRAGMTWGGCYLRQTSLIIGYHLP